MKNVRRFLSLILVSVMVFAMSMTAFAADEKGTITIENDHTYTDENGNKTPVPQKYEAYQIFKGDVDGGKLTNIEWGTGVDSTALLAALKADATVGPMFTDSKTAADVAKALSGQTNDSDVMQAIALIVSENLAAVAGTSTENASPFTITDLPYGYYFVKDINGLSVATSNPARANKYYLINVDAANNATIKVKTDVPSQEKKVKENQGENYTASEVERQSYGTGFNDVADYNVNDVVEFELLSTVPNFKGMKTYYYEFEDQYDTAFTLDTSSIKVEVVSGTNVENVLDTLTAGSDYTVTFDDTEVEIGQNRKVKQFDVIITDLVATLGEQNIGNKIKITFKATLNEGAVIGKPGNRNRSRLIYGNNPNEKGEPTPWDEVVVFTYELDVDKFDGDDSTKKLQDAEFKFYREVNNVKEYVVVDVDSKVQRWTTDETQASVLKTDASGTFKVSGLDEGTYYLKETKAPTGYNLLKDPVKVVIAADTNNGHGGSQNALDATTINIDDKGAAHTPNKPVGYETAPIANNQGVELPETGGIGTTIFYIVGALLALGAGVVLVTRRRMQK